MTVMEPVAVPPTGNASALKKVSEDAVDFDLPDFKDASAKAYELDGYLRPFEPVHEARYHMSRFILILIA